MARRSRDEDDIRGFLLVKVEEVNRAWRQCFGIAHKDLLCHCEVDSKDTVVLNRGFSRPMETQERLYVLLRRSRTAGAVSPWRSR